MGTQTIQAFVDAVNRHNIGRMPDLTTNDQLFIDAYGNEVTGRDKMAAVWLAYHVTKISFDIIRSNK